MEEEKGEMGGAVRVLLRVGTERNGGRRKKKRRGRHDAA
jgi:hypothetical protein